QQRFGDRPIAPLVDLGIDLLVQVADCAGADPQPLQRLGNVLYSAGGHAGQVHLDQGILDRRLAPAVTLDDGRREGQVAHLGNAQGARAGPGVRTIYDRACRCAAQGQVEAARRLYRTLSPGAAPLPVAARARNDLAALDAQPGDHTAAVEGFRDA